MSQTSASSTERPIIDARRPSGDNTASKMSDRTSVIWRRSDPSRRTDQSSHSPLRVDMKARRLPSGALDRDLRDMGMIQRGERLRLALKTQHAIVVGGERSPANAYSAPLSIELRGASIRHHPVGRFVVQNIS